MNPLPAGESMHGQHEHLFDFIPPPVERKQHGTYRIFQTLSASLIMENDPQSIRRKVQNYDASALAGWRALFTLTHTVIADPSTYQLLLFLVLISGMSFLVINLSGMDHSIEDDGIVSQRLLYLLSFILAGHVTISLNRWYEIRHKVFGPLWGSLENMFVLSCQLSPENRELQDTALRHGRLTMRLVFRAAQQGQDGGLEHEGLDDLEREGLLLPSERTVLNCVVCGTRPLTASMWLARALEEEYRAKGSNLSFPLSSLMKENFSFTFQQQMLALKGSIGGTLGYLGAPIPFLFVHLVNWTVVFSLFTLAVSTGVILAIGWARRHTGANQYVQHASSGEQWPRDPNHWYLNFVVTNFVQVSIYAIFSLGLVRICAKLHNPLARDDSSFPEQSYDSFFHNNCRALQVGLTFPLKSLSQGKLVQLEKNLLPAPASGRRRIGSALEVSCVCAQDSAK